MYRVIRCSNCDQFTYAREGQKTRKCPCGKTINLRTAKTYKRTKDERAAGEAVRKLQEEVHGKPEFRRYG